MSFFSGINERQFHCPAPFHSDKTECMWSRQRSRLVVGADLRSEIWKRQSESDTQRPVGKRCFVASTVSDVYRRLIQTHKVNRVESVYKGLISLQSASPVWHPRMPKGLVCIRESLALQPATPNGIWMRCDELGWGWVGKVWVWLRLCGLASHRGLKIRTNVYEQTNRNVAWNDAMIRATLQLLKSCSASSLTTLAAQTDDWHTLAVSDSIVADVSVSNLTSYQSLSDRCDCWKPTVWRLRRVQRATGQLMWWRNDALKLQSDKSDLVCYKWLFLKAIWWSKINTTTTWSGFRSSRLQTC